MVLTSAPLLSEEVAQYTLRILEKRAGRCPPLSRLVTFDADGAVLSVTNILRSASDQAPPPGAVDAQSLILALMRRARAVDEITDLLFVWSHQCPSQVVISRSHPDSPWELYGVRETVDFAPGELCAVETKAAITELLEMGLAVGPGLVKVIESNPRLALTAIRWSLRHYRILSRRGVQALRIIFAGASARAFKGDFTNCFAEAMADLLFPDTLPPEAMESEVVFGEFCRIIEGTLRFEKLPHALYPPSLPLEAAMPEAQGFMTFYRMSREALKF